MYARTLGITFSTLVLMFLLPIAAHAQVALPQQITLNQSPAAPAPNSTVFFSLESGFTNLSRVTISWYVNGSLQSSGVGQRSFSTTSGSGSSPRTVEARIQTEEGSAVSKQRTIQAGAVYLTWEGNTYTPDFFKGRALPTPGSTMRVYAESVLYSTTGARIPSSSLEYTWTINGVKSSQSGVGASSLTLSSPPKYGSTEIEVTVRNVTGTTFGSARTSVRAYTPSIVLYAGSSPYRKPLATNGNVSSENTTLVLEPFYTSASRPNDSWLSYSWKVNTIPVASEPNAPNRITLETTQSGDVSALVSVVFGNSFAPLVTQTKSWNITISQLIENSLFGEGQ